MSRALENGRAALATASGMSAQITGILAIVQPGQHIVASSLLYGGTYSQFDVALRKMGIETTFVDADAPENFRKALRDNTRLLYAETLGNPKINVLDIEPIAQIAHAAGVPLMIDNTMASPVLCRPFDWGADIVVHSATKYLGGHGTTLGGVLVERGKFDWGNGKFPGHGRAVEELPRRQVLGNLRRLRLHDESPHGGAARARRRARTAVGLPAAAGD